jgi:hypothetical protein
VNLATALAEGGKMFRPDGGFRVFTY